mgnify:CR=1 FL=1
MRFYLGDCLTVLPALDPGSVGVVVTSPPYNIGVRYGTYRDTLTRDEYLAWTDKWVGAAARVALEGRTREIDLGHSTVRATRLTYVGELGWELYVPSDFAVGVFDLLHEAGADLGIAGECRGDHQVAVPEGNQNIIPGTFLNRKIDITTTRHPTKIYG